MQTEHGGDIYAPGGEKVLDFSVNLNPLGPPACVLESVRESAALCDRYPDPWCRALRRAIAVHDGVPEQFVLCGNGASDLIFRLAAALKPRRALIAAPTFAEYENSLQQNNCKVIKHYTKEENGFHLTPSILSRLRPGVELVLLCSPNNPTGQLLPGALLLDILTRCREIGALLAVDECFLPLCTGEKTDLTPELPAGNLLLLRALTKSYAMPGLRLGYALCAGGALLGRMAAAGPPWSVSTAAQQAGIAALTEAPDWPERALEGIGQERRQLMDGLKRLGFQPLSSDTCFILFRAPGEQDLREKLLKKGILIRSCGNFDGLGPEWYRVAVRQHEDNLRLLRALERRETDG